MKMRIGLLPEGVVYPVWAWYKQNGVHKSRICAVNAGATALGMRITPALSLSSPDDQALLSDFDSWHIILNNGLFSESEEEADQKDAYYDSLPAAEQKAYKEKNWEKVFDITPFKKDWTLRGDWVQATVWELRKDMIRDVRFFRTGKYKMRLS